MDMAGHCQRRNSFHPFRDRAPAISEFIPQFCDPWLALRLGNTIAFGRYRQEHHNDQKHPDQLIHLKQETVC